MSRFFEGKLHEHDFSFEQDRFRSRIELFMQRFYNDDSQCISLENLHHYRLFTDGDKELCIFFDDQISEVTSWIQKSEHSSYEPGSTARLYLLAKNAIEQYVRSSGKDFTYHFMTENPKMLAWARTAGKELFHWTQEQRVSFSEDGNHGYCFTSIFRSKNT